MKVHELRARLEPCDPNAEVYVVTSEMGAAEALVAGVLTRAEIAAHDDDDVARHEHLPQGDVFICEGRHVRFARTKALAAALRKK